MRSSVAPVRPTFLASLGAFLADFGTFTGRRHLVTCMALMLGGALIEGIGLVMLVPLLAVLTGDGGGTLQIAANRGFAALGVTTPLHD